MDATNTISQEELIKWVEKRVKETEAQKNSLIESKESHIRIAAKGGKQCVYKEMLNFITTHKIIEK